MTEQLLAVYSPLTIRGKVATAEFYLLGKAEFFSRRAASVKDASAKLDLLFASKAMTDAVQILRGTKRVI